MKKIAILILNHRQDELTLECLNSLKNVKYEDFEIILVNNESIGNFPVKWDMEKHPLKIIEEKKNLGCAGGRNLGIGYFMNNSDADYLFFLDNDAVVDVDILTELVKVAESKEDIGLVGMKVYYFNEPNKFWIAGGAKLDLRSGCFYNSGQGELDVGQYDRDGRVFDSLPGGFTFIKRKVIELIGMLDERFFIYYEDPDWCLRLRKYGLKIAFACNAKVWHKVSSSLGRESSSFYYYRTRNRLLFMWKNFSKTTFAAFFVNFSWEFIRTNILGFLIEKKHKLFFASLAGVCDFFVGRFYNQRTFSS
ncbi:MAG: glycosyltransferase family 2 protein [Candidatus Omnitrophica bacterium]|nr:glycosyltransferase family 2 protein [Candidatus Omnitrophota bacterium]